MHGSGTLFNVRYIVSFKLISACRALETFGICVLTADGMLYQIRCTRTHTHISTHTHARTHTYKHKTRIISSHTHARTYTHIGTHAHTRTHTYKYVCIIAGSWYVNTHTRTHTRTHTYKYVCTIAGSWYVTGIPHESCLGKWHLGWRRQSLQNGG